MRCHICDRVLDEPEFNKDMDAYEPCPTCMTVVNDLLGEFADKPYIIDDDTVDFDLLQASYERYGFKMPDGYELA